MDRANGAHRGGLQGQRPWGLDSLPARLGGRRALRVAQAGLIFALLALLTSEASAQPQRWAVVIGVEKYRDPTIRPLRYAAKDARAMRDWLVDPKGGTFSAANVQLLLDEQVTQKAVRSALGTTLARRAVQGDTVFIYYAGHGGLEADLANREADGHAKYLLPYDTDAKDLFASAINMTEIETFFSRIKADTVVLVLDTCYSGAGAGRGFANLAAGGRDIAVKGDFLDRLAQGKGRAILTAADANEVALEAPELAHGLFTYHFLEGLRGKADAQGKGYVSLQDAYRYVYDRVARQSRQLGGNQNPKLIAQAVGDIVLAGQMRAVAVAPAPPEPGVTVIPRAGSLLLRSPRESVEVWLAERRIGEAGPGADLLVENLQAGKYPVRARARRPGVKPWEREVQVVADRRAEVVIDIEPLGSSGVITGEDGAEMVLVRAGEFWMGSDANDPAARPEEKPRHKVHLDAFYIDKYEVTNAQFEPFVRATGHRTTAGREGYGWVWRPKDGKWQWVKVDGATWRAPTGSGSGTEPTHPVVQVSWRDAEAYCKWAGKRLPTEAEWEKAARGADGPAYPWGADWDATKANGGSTAQTPKPVGSHPGGASPYGAHDMAGNVSEWVADWYSEGYYARSPERNPRGPGSGSSRVLRGGSFPDVPIGVRAAARSHLAPGNRDSATGFRCARGHP